VNQAVLLAALIGATLIVVRGTILSRLRKVWPQFFECSQCVGFWIGALAGGTSIVGSFERGWWFDALALGCAVSVVSMGTDIVLLKLADGPGEEQRR
jgi:hypothetical protein